MFAIIELYRFLPPGRGGAARLGSWENAVDRFQAMETFTRVVEAGSFRRAAETLGVLPSTVTKTIKELEAHLGAQLLKRTTRALSITDAGLRFYDSCKAILQDVDAAEALISEDAATIRGTIRAGMTPSLARHFVIPQLSRFAARYPNIEISLQLGDAVIDVVQQGVDCVLRAGELQASSLIVRQVATFRWFVCGAPSYLERHGEPEDLAALHHHLAVGYLDSRTGRSAGWTFKDGDQLVVVPMRTQLSVNDTDAYVAAGVAGLGLIRASNYMVRDSLAQGRLVRVLSGLDGPEQPLSILYPPSRHLSPAVRAFIDWCADLVRTEALTW